MRFRKRSSNSKEDVNGSSSTPPSFGNATADPQDDHFSARRSGRIVSNINSDNDIWCEYLAVVEMLVPGGATRTGEERYELQIRSFFESTLTGSRAWDEPPSGAHQIQYASAEAREMAEAQMEDLQAGVEIGAFLEGEKEDGVIEAGTAGDGRAEKGRSLRKFVPKRWRQGNSQARIQAPQNLVYKPGSTTRELLDSARQTRHHHAEEDLEQTILASLQEASAKEESCRVTQLEEEEAINMAKAISLSEESYNSFHEDLQHSAFGCDELSNSQNSNVEVQSSIKEHDGLVVKQNETIEKSRSIT